MKLSIKSILLAASACVLALATPVAAQDASAQGHLANGASKAAVKAIAKYKGVQVSEDAVAQVPESGCHVVHWEADYISHPTAYHTECDPR